MKRYTIQNLIYPAGHTARELTPAGPVRGERRAVAIEIGQVDTLEEVKPYLDAFDIVVIDNEEGRIITENELN